MFDANKILGTLMESGMSRSGQSRFQRAAEGSRHRSAGGGGLGDLARSLLGGGGSHRRPGGGGLGGIGSLLGGGGGTGIARSGGAMGLLGMLAGAAMQHFGPGGGRAQAGSGQPGGQGATQPGLAETSTPYEGGSSADENSRAMVMIRAMITAAKADGEIDPQERQKILGRLEEAGADAEAQAFIRDEMAGPVNMQAIVSAVDSPHTAIEAYAASLFAIDVDTEAEAAYMRQLAQGLGLDPALVRELHESLEAPQLH